MYLYFLFAIKYTIYVVTLLFCLEMLLKYIVQKKILVFKWLICSRLTRIIVNQYCFCFSILMSLGTILSGI